jgi:hypothetical protein
MSAVETAEKPLSLHEILQMRKYFRHTLKHRRNHEITATARDRLVLQLIEDFLDLRAKDKDSTVEVSSEDLVAMGLWGVG